MSRPSVTTRARLADPPNRAKSARRASASVRSVVMASYTQCGVIPASVSRLYARMSGRVDVGPPQRGRQREPERPRIESGRQIHDEVDVVALHETQNDLVEDRSAHDHRPRARLPVLERAHDLLALGPGKPPGPRIHEERVRPLALHGAIERDPACSVGNVANGHTERGRGSALTHCGKRCAEGTGADAPCGKRMPPPKKREERRFAALFPQGAGPASPSVALPSAPALPVVSFCA